MDKKEEMSLNFMGILSGGATKKPEVGKAESEGSKLEGSTSKGGEQHLRELGLGHDNMMSDGRMGGG